MSKEVLAGIIIVALAVFGWIYLSVSRADTFINPITHENERVALTRAEQIEIGTSSRTKIIEELGGLEIEQAVSSRVQTVFSKLLIALGRLERRLPHPGGDVNHLSNFPFRVMVTEDPEIINAFASPGGNIYLTRGLYDRIGGNDDALAAVLGHEIGHVSLRHTARQYETLMKGYYALSIIDLLLGRKPHILLDVSIIVNNLFQLRFSRDHETASDHFGYLLLCEAGYDPGGMAELMDVLKEASDLEGALPIEWALTHPLPQSRIDYVNRLTCALP